VGIRLADGLLGESINQSISYCFTDKSRISLQFARYCTTMSFANMCNDTLCLWLNVEVIKFFFLFLPYTF